MRDSRICGRCRYIAAAYNIWGVTICAYCRKHQKELVIEKGKAKRYIKCNVNINYWKI